MAKTYYACRNNDCELEEKPQPVPHGVLMELDRVLCIACGETMDEVDYRELESEPFRSRGMVV